MRWILPGALSPSPLLRVAVDEEELVEREDEEEDEDELGRRDSNVDDGLTFSSVWK